MMGLLDIFKKQSTKEKIASKRTNYVGESTDILDQDGNLPFGWVAHNQKYVDMIEKDLQAFRQAISDAKTDVEKYAALESFVLFVQNGIVHYHKVNECVGKYFEEYIFNSMEMQQRTKEYRELKEKMKRQG